MVNIKELQDQLFESQKIISTLQQENSVLQEHIRTLELENTKLKKKQTLHQGGVLTPR